MADSDRATIDQSGRDVAGDDERTGRLRSISDSMMQSMGRLRAMEAEKRTLAMGSERFDELAREIERESRVIFDLAAEQRAIGESIPDQEQRATIDVGRD